MARSFITIEASAVYATNAPTLEVLVNGAVYSSAVVTATTGVGSDILTFEIDYTGNYPSSLSFRFSDGFAEGGRSITVENARINGQLIDRDADMSSNVALNQNDSVNVTIASTQHLYGRETITEGDLGTVTNTGTGGDDLIRGGGSEDVIDGNGGSDRINGLDSDDAIIGDAGDDYLFGGEGNDIIIGGAGRDVVSGDAGDDLLHGQDGDDFVLGGAGNDMLNGGAGNDVLAGDSGNDIMYGDDGDDRMIGDDGNDSIYGDAGNDTISGGAGDDYIDGGADDDNIFGVSGANEIYGGSGNDNILGGADDDTIDGGDGSDFIFAGDGNDVVDGGNQDDNIFGDDGDDTLNGGGGDDFISGGAGADIVDGGAGDDIIHGHSLDYFAISSILNNNADLYYSYETGSFYQLVDAGFNITWNAAQTAAAGITINGVGGHLAVITSEREHDELVANVYNGNNTFIGASDSDTEGLWQWEFGPEAGLQFWDEGAGSALNGSYANWTAGQPNDSDGTQDYLYILDTNDQWADIPVSGGGGFVDVEQYVIEWEGGLFSDDNADDQLSGGNGADQIYGWGGDDTINGGGGNDFLYGGDGDDTISGDDNDDVIVGGNGSDILNGGNGNDLIYAAVAGTVGAQTVVDAGGGGGVVLINEDFGSDEGGFAYDDGVFGRSGPSNNYASGTRITGDGDAANGALQISLGGINNNTINDMSGAWEQTFNVASDLANVTLDFSYRVLDAVVDGDPFDNGEDTQLFAEIDGTTYSNDANPYFFEITGNAAGSSYDSGWQQISLNIGSLTAGNYTLSLGGLLTRKTFASEEMDIRFDDILLAETSTTTLTIADEDFEGGASGWSDNSTDNTEAGSFTEFLGRVAGNGSNNQVISKTYTIDNTGDIAISFDAYIIDSWDSEDFDVFINDTRIISNNFQGGNNDGSDSGTFAGGSWTRTAITDGDLGFWSGQTWNDDVIYEYTITLDNYSSGTLELGFGSEADQGIADESFGIDNVLIEQTVAAGAGNDATSSGNDSAESNTIDGGAGDDVIYGSAGDDYLYGGAGNDTIYSDSQQTYTVDDALAEISGLEYNEDTNSFYYYENNADQAPDAFADAASTTLNGVAGHIVHITSQVENDYIDTLTGGSSTWLGAQDTAVEGEWRWVGGQLDGQLFWLGDENGSSQNGFYENFNGGEPNDYGSGEDYIEILANGTWNDNGGPDNSGLSRGYVIEWEASEIFGFGATEMNGGEGADDLYGSEGADLFIFDDNADAFTNPDTVHNFDANDGDAIDISDILDGLGVDSSNISDYVEISEGNGVRVDTSGSGSFNAGDTITTFSGFSAVSDEATMLANGNLIIF